MSSEYLWYIPNQVQPGHRGDAVVAEHNSLETLTGHATALEEHGWNGALLGTGWGRHPRLYFGGASDAAERVAATEADVQLFWGEPLDGVGERIERLRKLGDELGREHAPLEFGLRITTLVRDTTERAWADAEARVAEMAKGRTGSIPPDPLRRAAVGRQRLLDLAARGEVLDDNLYTTPGRFGGGGAGTAWLVGSAEEVARSLRRYQDIGITHFVLSDTPYLPEIRRQGDQLLPLLRG